MPEAKAARATGLSQFDVVIVDQGPGQTGRRDLTDESGPDSGLPPLVIMGRPDDRDEKSEPAGPGGRCHYVAKPVRRLELLVALEASLGRESELAQALRPESPEGVITQDEPLRLLLVEDYQHNRLIIGKYLETLSCEIVAAEKRGGGRGGI